MSFCVLDKRWVTLVEFCISPFIHQAVNRSCEWRHVSSPRLWKNTGGGGWHGYSVRDTQQTLTSTICTSTRPNSDNVPLWGRARVSVHVQIQNRRKCKERWREKSLNLKLLWCKSCYVAPHFPQTIRRWDSSEHGVRVYSGHHLVNGAFYWPHKDPSDIYFNVDLLTHLIHSTQIKL